MMAFITGSFGIIQPYTNPYLLAAGLSKWEINLVAGIALLSGMVVQPLIGRLSDTWDARKPLILGAAIVAAIAYSLFPISNSFAILLILSIFGTNGFTYLNTVSGVIIGRIAGPARSGGAYTRFRVLGSITYIIVAVVCGKLLPNRGTLTAADLQPIFIIGPIIYIAIGLLSTRIPDPKKGTIVHDLVTSDDASEKT
jgi:MFS family permease